MFIGDIEMSDVAEVFKDVIIRVIESLASRKPPKNELYIKHLLARLREQEGSIEAATLFNYLVCAGYGMDDIIQILIESRLITNNADLIHFRDGIRRVLFSIKCEGE